MMSFWMVLLGGVCLGLSFLDARFGGLAFVALAPLFQRIRVPGIGAVYWQSLLVGIIAFALANYWIYLFLVNLSGSRLLSAILSAVYFVYGAHSLALLFLGLYVLRRSVPWYGFAMLAPMVAAIFLHYYPLLFEFNLALTQVQFPLLIAPLVYTGPIALVAVIVLVNVLFAEWLGASRQTMFNPKEVAMGLQSYRLVHQKIASRAVVALFFIPAIWLLVGWVAHTLAATQLQNGTSINLGFIQTDDPPGAAPLAAQPGYTLAYPPELAQAQVLAELGAEIVIWPESRPKGLLTHPWVWENHLEQARLMNTDLILQDLARADSVPQAYVNASLLFSRDGRTQAYHKVKLIPFGEVIPEPLNFPPVRRWLLEIFKNIYRPVLPGGGPQIFSAAGIKLLPLICYEILDRQYVLDALKSYPDTQLIVLQSNDRWFLSRQQVMMHNAVAQLRAVETARPVLHVVNGGPSFLIDAQGKIIAMTDHGITGAYLAEVMLPKQGPD